MGRRRRPGRMDNSFVGNTNQISRWSFFSIFCILTVGFWAYHDSFGGVLVFDDLIRIRGNPNIRHLWPIWNVLRATSRPLVELSLAVNYSLSGTRVFGYHVVNLLIHLASSLILFGIIRRTLRTESLRSRYGDAADGLALAISLLWAVHPLQTESVTYIIQRAESLMGLFYLSTLYCVIRGITSEKARCWYIGAVLACAAGMASKPIMVTAPLMILLYDRTFMVGTFKKALFQRKGPYVGLAATWGLFVLISKFAPADPAAGLAIGITPLLYAKTQPSALLHYLKLSFWPAPLCIDYGPIDYLTESRMPPGSLFPLLIIGVLATFTLWAFRTHKAIGFLGIWFFLILAPSSSLIPIRDYTVEHRMYLSLAAVIGLFVFAGNRLWSLLPISKPILRRNLSIGSVAFLVGLLGTMTIRRNQDYSSEETLWRQTISANSENPRPHNNLGTLLAQQGSLEEAKAHFIRALQLNPQYADAHNHLGAILAQQGSLEEAKAHFIQALQFNPKYADAYDSLGLLSIIQGHFEEAKDHFIQALELDPNYADAHNHLGIVLAQQGSLEEAKTHFTQALQLNPNLVEAKNSLNLLLKQSHENP